MVLGDGRRWIIVVQLSLPSVDVLRHNGRVELGRECSVGPLGRHQLVLHHHGRLGVHRQSPVADETWFSVLLILRNPDIIIRGKAFFNLAVEINHVLELVENVFVCLLEPTLAP